MYGTRSPFILTTNTDILLRMRCTYHCAVRWFSFPDGCHYSVKQQKIDKSMQEMRVSMMRFLNYQSIPSPPHFFFFFFHIATQMQIFWLHPAQYDSHPQIRSLHPWDLSSDMCCFYEYPNFFNNAEYLPPSLAHCRSLFVPSPIDTWYCTKLFLMQIIDCFLNSSQQYYMKTN